MLCLIYATCLWNCNATGDDKNINPTVLYIFSTALPFIIHTNSYDNTRSLEIIVILSYYLTIIAEKKKYERTFHLYVLTHFPHVSMFLWECWTLWEKCQYWSKMDLMHSAQLANTKFVQLPHHWKVCSDRLYGQFLRTLISYAGRVYF